MQLFFPTMVRKGMIRSIRIATFLVVLIAGPVAAQMPRVGIVDFYGLRRLTPADLSPAVRVQIGDSLTRTTDDLRNRLLEVPGVLDADVSLICCEVGRSILYVGVREAGAPMLEFNRAPTGPELLPPEILTVSSRYMRAMIEGVRKGEAGEDDSAGHSLSLYPPARAEQEPMIAFAANNTELLRRVLRNSGNGEHRALAAQVIAYVSDKTSVVDDLVAAVRDPDDQVRNNAVRALGVMAMYAQSHPDAGLNVPYAPFIDLLTSLEWTDRNKASFALAALTTTRDAELLRELRERALPSLIEMARWRAPGHALAAAVVLGRIGGLPDDEIFRLFQRDREALIRTLSGL
jgi:hypothetical protein